MKSVSPMADEVRSSSVKETLIQMKTLAEICVDLAFASLMYSDQLVAEQVLVIEKQIDELYKRLLDHLSLSIKTFSQAEQLRIYFTIGEANNIISDSAADMASLVIRGIQLEDEIKLVQQYMDQLVDLVPLAENSPLCGESELSAHLHDVLGVDIVGIISADGKFSMSYADVMRPGDLLIFRGPLLNVNEFIKLAKGEISTVEEARIRIINDVEDKPSQPLKKHQNLLVTMKESAELVVDLAYLYALEDLPLVKNLILATEEKVDNLQYEIIDEVLELYKNNKISKETLIGYLSIADSFEEIADAAIKIAFGVPLKHKPYKLLEDVVEDSSEAVDYIRITKDSPYAGKTIKEAELTGDFFQILAVRKKGKYFFMPNENVIIHPGDGLLIKEYSSPGDPDSSANEK